MKVPVIISLLFIKALLSPTDGRYVEKSNSKDLIRCYTCEEYHPLMFGAFHKREPESLHDIFPDDSRCDTRMALVDKSNGYLCKVSIEPIKSAPDFVSIKYSVATKEECATDSKDKVHDTICEDSTCNKLSLCCDTDLCNTDASGGMGIKALAYYFNNPNSEYEDNYSKYTNTSCAVTDSKSKYNEGYKNCLAVIDRGIYGFNKNLGALAKSNKDYYTAKILSDNTEEDDGKGIIFGDKKKNRVVLPNKLWIQVKTWLKLLKDNAS